MSADGFARYEREQLVAPLLLWSEVTSALHEALWRGDLDEPRALAALAALGAAPIRPRAEPGLVRAAWLVADEFGWAKTYDAEYVALARLLHCRLVTVDERLRRATDRLGFVVSPTEL